MRQNNKNRQQLESELLPVFEQNGKQIPDEDSCTKTEELRLVRDENGLYLTDGKLRVRGDFAELLPRIRQSNLERELLIRAAKPWTLGDFPLLLDATAGMGEDSFLLAAAGFRVILYEYDPVIAALLQDALLRAGQDPRLEMIAKRMTLRMTDSVAAMREWKEETPAVILLDPMFPERSKSGRIGKKFQLLQQLERPCSEEKELLEAALDVCPVRIMIKRPLKGPWLNGLRPDYSISGKAIRYDCLINIAARKERYQTSEKRF